MTLHVPSFLLGFLLAFVLLGAMCALDWWRERQERARALDDLLVDVAIQCIKKDARRN